VARAQPSPLRNLDLELRRLNAGSRVLPDFIIAGAQKGGTSSLYSYLVRHSHVVAARKKEVHFFDRHFAKGERWYRASFSTRRAMQATEKEHGAPVLTGEASPSYTFHPLAAERMAALLPRVRIVLLLRDPVERAHSHWRMSHERGADRLDFESAIDAEDDRLAGEMDRVRADDTYFSKPLKHWSYVARGLYDVQMERWLGAFPREQLLVRSAEEFFADPHGVHERVLDFLDLPRQPLADAEVVNRGATRSPMADATRRRLIKRFRDHDERLFDQLGERFDWSGGRA
jgi:hypothetical protein